MKRVIGKLENVETIWNMFSKIKQLWDLFSPSVMIFFPLKLCSIFFGMTTEVIDFSGNALSKGFKARFLEYKFNYLTYVFRLLSWERAIERKRCSGIVSNSDVVRVHLVK